MLISYTSPWFFTRGGQIELNTGALRLIGDNGSYWSGTASTSESSAYVFNFYATGVRSSYNLARWQGMPVRCMDDSFSITITISTSPWFFTRGGYVDLYTGSLRVMSLEGIYWSSTASTSASSAYRLNFNATDTQPSVSYWRWCGWSVRCVGAGSPPASTTPLPDQIITLSN